MANRLKSHDSQSPSIAELRFKLTRIVSYHDQLKVAFHQLKSQIEIGLLEAEDVFRSLAIPLTKLVGLKAVEMAEEGRTSTIYMTSDLLAQSCWRNEIRTQSPESSPSVTERVDHNHKIPNSQEDYTTKATTAGKELMQKQRLQLTQLVHLLRKIETEVNSSQNNIFQTISDHQASMHKFFQKAITYISAVYQSGQSHDAFLVTLKILKATFGHVCDVLGSVEGGVDDLMHELAQLMCNPMVEYIKGLKAEITTGTCPRLLAIVEEMGGAIKDGRLELEEARMKARGAEERKVEAVSRLEESEERVRKMQMQIGFFLEAKKGLKGQYTRHKLLNMEEDQTKDEKLLWELLQKKKEIPTTRQSIWTNRAPMHFNQQQTG